MNFTDLIQPVSSEDVTPQLVADSKPPSVSVKPGTPSVDIEEIPNPEEFKRIYREQMQQVVELLVSRGVPRYALVSAADYLCWRMSEHGKMVLSDARR